MAIHSLLRSLPLGRLAYHLWYRPAARLQAVFAAGGPWEVYRTEQGRRAMERAALHLPQVTGRSAGPPLVLHLLTGKKFWYQTAFCLWTFARQSGRTLAPVIYDDGTLADAQREPLARLFPAIRFVAQSETIARLDGMLPVAQYPYLRERWLNYPNIRKLTDVHVGQSGWKLVLDSDLLFFNPPQFLTKWLEQPTVPLHAVDCETAYGYPRPLMNALAGAPVADLVNVGLTGLSSSALDWDQLEYWCARLIQTHGTHYFLEQALIAMLVAGKSCAIAPAGEFITKPDGEEARRCGAVMHHYVANSKPAYFRHCWRVAMAGGTGGKNHRS